jgi:hypothetical protein
MSEQRPHRNVRPELASLRGHVASLTYRGAPAAEIESARARLRSAKAHLAIRELLELPVAERAELAALLLTGGGADAA